MPVKPVGEEPEVAILKWGIMRDLAGFRLVGFRADTLGGRVTSPIVEFDEHARIAVTATGRRYHLSGEPDPTAAALLIRMHAIRWGLSEGDVAMVDVSEVALALAPKPAGGLN